MSPIDAGSLVHTQARWREIFCDCGEDGGDPMCLGCAVLRSVLHDWGILGLQHMLRRINALEGRYAARERALHERITTLETQLELLRPRGFLED